MPVTDQIRPATPDDYPALADLLSRVTPEHPVQAEELAYWDAHRDAKIAFSRLVALRGGRLVAAAERGQMPWMFHPRKFRFDLGVAPEARRQGLGATLYQRLLDELAPFDPLSLRTTTREDRAEALGFLQRRGFGEEGRDWESRLDPKAARLEPFASALERVREAGIELVSLAELAPRDPEHRLKLHALEMAAAADAPQPEPFTPLPFGSWQARVFDDPNLLPEGFLVAVHGERYVGMTQFWASKTPGAGLFNGFTGVLREYRGRGVAGALKAKNMRWAREQGYRLVKTFNSSENRSMLGINEALGFEKQPAWITLVKTFGEAP